MKTMVHTALAASLVVWTLGCSDDAEFRSGASVAPPVAVEPGSDDVVGVTPAPSVQTPAPEPSEPAAPSAAKVTLERTFAAGRIETLSFAFDPEYRRATQTVRMTEAPPAAQRLKQVERREREDAFKQGKDGQTFGPETFNISNSGKLDLLVVVDNSTSMSDEQVNLATKLDPLLSKISNTDWQIGVVTTSSPCLRLGRTIKKSDANPSQDFQAAVIVPLSGTVIEKGFPMAVRALRGECNGTTTPWLRAGSSVGVLILSDEDNCGSHAGEGCPGETGETAQQMVSFLTGPAGIRPVGQARVYGIIDGADTCGSSAFPAPKYKAAIDATGGTWGRICDSDYSKTLQSISDNVSRIVKREFALTHAPDAGTLDLHVDGVAVPSAYTLNGNVLTLTNVAPSDAMLSVTYAYGSVPKHLRFKLAASPDPATMSVKVNGALEDQARYSYDAATREVVFVNLPADDAELKITYRSGALPRTFTLQTSDLLELTKVEVDAVEAQGFAFDAGSGTLTLAQAPRDGADVVTTYRTKSGRATRYAAVFQDSGDVDRVGGVDADGTPVEVRLERGDLVFAAADVVAGREIHVSYDVGYDPADLVVNLAQEPLAGSLSFESDPGRPACSEISVVASTVRMSCPGQDVGSIKISYKSLVDRLDTFMMGAGIPDDATWLVLVDGREVTSFAREGTTIRVPLGYLAADSAVTIQATFTP